MRSSVAIVTLCLLWGCSDNKLDWSMPKGVEGQTCDRGACSDGSQCVAALCHTVEYGDRTCSCCALEGTSDLSYTACCRPDANHLEEGARCDNPLKDQPPTPQPDIAPDVTTPDTGVDIAPQDNVEIATDTEVAPVGDAEVLTEH